jgi:hypothetical protein
MGEPMHVYPDPNGGARNNMVPSDTRLAGGSIASGAAAVVTAAAGSGTAPGGPFLFLQDVGRTLAPGGFLGFHAASSTYVALFTFFAALSVVLATINLVLGLRLRARLLPLAERVGKACDTEGVLTWWKTAGPS